MTSHEDTEQSFVTAPPPCYDQTETNFVDCSRVTAEQAELAVNTDVVSYSTRGLSMHVDAFGGMHMHHDTNAGMTCTGMQQPQAREPSTTFSQVVAWTKHNSNLLELYAMQKVVQEQIDQHERPRMAQKAHKKHKKNNMRPFYNTPSTQRTSPAAFPMQGSSMASPYVSFPTELPAIEIPPSMPAYFPMLNVSRSLQCQPQQPIHPLQHQQSRDMELDVLQQLIHQTQTVRRSTAHHFK